jgi:CheY-like chemotaxis protein
MLKVLIVEDESLVAMLVEDILVELGHQVAASIATLDKALVEAERTDADFAVLDLNLNGKHTYPVAEILKRRGVRFMFVTGYGAAGLGEQWRREVVLQKPFQTEEFAAAVARAAA